MADTVQVTAGSGTSIATDDVPGVGHVQRVKRQVGADGLATDFLDKSSRSDTFTTTTNGATVDVSAQGMSRFALQVKGTGAVPTSWEVVLEVSLNGSQFTPILTHKSGVDADGSVLLFGAAGPVLYFRSRCVSVALGPASEVVATIAAKP
jgi:hypothetical protein